MEITFVPLAEYHFPLLLKWLQTTHVKAWLDRDMDWTLELISTKYSSYVKGYKLENNVAKPINAYIIYLDEVPIGYIQAYNAYDFSRSKPLKKLPTNLAAFDILIGEESALKRGLASEAMRIFFAKHVDTFYTHIFADPDSKNFAAIRSYEKVGFKKIAEQLDTGEFGC